MKRELTRDQVEARLAGWLQQTLTEVRFYRANANHARMAGDERGASYWLRMCIDAQRRAKNIAWCMGLEVDKIRPSA